MVSFSIMCKRITSYSAEILLELVEVVRVFMVYFMVIKLVIFKVFEVSTRRLPSNGLDFLYVIADEISNRVKFDRPGLVAMANAGRPHTNGSQFFISVAPRLETLDQHHTIFGHVAEGFVINFFITTISYLLLLVFSVVFKTALNTNWNYKNCY